MCKRIQINENDSLRSYFCKMFFTFVLLAGLNSQGMAFQDIPMLNQDVQTEHDHHDHYIQVIENDDGYFVSIQVEEMDLPETLKVLADQMNVGLSWATGLDFEKPVSMKADQIDFYDLLNTLLNDRGLEYLVSHDQNVLIIRELGKMDEVEDARQITISGRVLDGNTGEPIPAVTIVIQGTTNGTSTDADGIYELTVPSTESILIFSSVGYVSTELVVGNQLVIDVELYEDTIMLDDIIVTGYGTTRRADMTTAISSVPNVSDQINRPITHLQDVLQGSVPGVTVIRQGGDPTQQPNVIIRGQGTLSASSPLWVVDGMPYYGDSINPRDIESIDILKDASAAAVYGAQASSGVILITTKRGRSTSPRVEIDYIRGYQQATNLPEALLADEYQTAQTQAHRHAGDPAPGGHDPAQNPWGAITRTIWMDEVFRTAPYDNLNLRVSGQYDELNYSTSFGYHGEEGILLGTGYDRFSWRLRTDFNVTDNIRLGQNLYLSHTGFVGTNTSSDFSGVITNAIFMNPAAPVFDPETTFHGTVPSELSHFAGAYGDVYNPVALLKRPQDDRNNLNINANAFGEVDFLENFRFRSSFNVLWRNNSRKQFTPATPEIGRSSPETILLHNESQSFYWMWDQQLDYNQTIGAHNFGITGVYSADYKSYEAFGVDFRGFENESDYFRYINNAGDTSRPGSASAWEDIMLSMVGIANYSFDDRYFLSGSLRRDVSSRLPVENRHDFFPSVSGAWKISSEQFFNVDQIDMLKLRASWGQIGNIQSVSLSAFATPLQRRLSHIGDPPHRPLAFHANEIPNPDLKWERSETYNVGLDLHMLRDKFIFTAEYYEKYTRGIILRNEPNTHQGMGLGPNINAGDVSNKGVEFSLIYRGQLKDLVYSVNANLSSNNNKLESFGDFGSDVIRHSDAVRGVLYPFQSTPGQPLRSYYLIPSDGIFQSQSEIDNYTGPNGSPIQPNARPGDLRFLDVNGDGRINSEDKMYMGSAIPDMTYGLNIDLMYKDFDLRAFLQGVNGNKLFFGYKYNAYQAAIQPYNMDRRALNAWSPQNTNTDIPVMSTQDPNGNYGTESDWYLYDASYLRIRNVTLGYNVPADILNRIGDAFSVRIYASVDNLYTFTKYPGIDPEIGDRIDSAFYPQSRVFTFGINLSL